MPTGRVEAFSDGVLAIIITVMLLQLDIPHGSDLAALRADAIPLLTYVLSFTYVGLYWNNHHHMFQLTERVNGGILWANMLLLFWLSLLPFTTAWMDATDFARVPVIAYGVDLLAAALAYVWLQHLIIASQGEGSRLGEAVGRDRKGKVSPVLYLAGIACAAFIGDRGGAGNGALRIVSVAFFVAVAVMWLVPDRRIERVLAERAPQTPEDYDPGA